MLSVLQTPRWSSRSGPKGEDLEDIERWFFRQGVPQFVYAYSPGDSMPVLFYVLLVVVAFNLTVQPWVAVSPWFLLVAPAALVSLGLFIGVIAKVMIINPASYLIFELTKERIGLYMSFKDQISCLISHPIRLLVLFAGLFLLGCAVLLGGPEIYRSSAAVNFIVMAGLLWSSAALSRLNVWANDGATFKKRRRLYVIVAGAVIYFALEGGLLPNSSVLMDRVLGSSLPAAVPVPQGLAALLVTAIIAVQTLSLRSEPMEAGDVIIPQQSNVFFPALSLLILVLAAETTIFPYVGPVWLAAAIPLAAVVGFASLHIVLRRRQDKPTPTQANRRPKWLTTPTWLKAVASYPSVRGFINYPGVAVFVVLYLVACPLLVGTLAASDENQPLIAVVGNPANAKSALLLTFGIDLFYLSLVLGIPLFGLVQVTRWRIREALAYWRGFVSGLSILLVFTTFLLLSAETWKTMAEISTVKYLFLLGSLFGLLGALLISVNELSVRSDFTTWSEVRAAAMPEEVPYTDSEIKDLLGSKELKVVSITNTVPKHPLGGLETINAFILMMTYEMFYFFPVMVIATIVFLMLGYFAVPPDVVAGWVYGDGASASLTSELASRPLIEQPRLRVALLLGAFSTLYLAVEMLKDADNRRELFGISYKVVRRCLAVRLAYREVLARRNLLQPWPSRPFWHDRQAHHRGGAPSPPATSHDVNQTGPATPNGKSSRSAATMGQTADNPDQPGTP